MSADDDNRVHRWGPRSAGGCHVRQPRFEALNNHLHLSIIYATFGQQGPPGLRSRNHLPHHRLFAVPSGSIASGGRVGFERDGRARHLKLQPGAVYLLPGDIGYTFTFEPGLLLGGCHFDLELFAGRDALPVGIAPQRLDLPPGDADACWALRDRIDDLAGVTRFRAWVLACCSQVLAQPLDELLGQIRAAERFAPVLAAIEAGGAELRVADLAPLVDLSPATLSRRFSAELGVPLKTYLQRRLTQRACEALLRSDRSIKAIAEDLGFSSEFYFSRFVKQRVGLAPSAYRQLAETGEHPG